MVIILFIMKIFISLHIIVVLKEIEMIIYSFSFQHNIILITFLMNNNNQKYYLLNIIQIETTINNHNITTIITDY